MWIRTLLLVSLSLAATYPMASGEDAKEGRCDTACKWAGYDGGQYVLKANKSELCRCYEDRDFHGFTGTKRVVVPRKPHPPRFSYD